MQTRAVYEKQPPPWCYRSLAKIDCYNSPLKGAAPDHMINATLPPPQDPAPTILNPGPPTAITPAPAGAKPSAEQIAPVKAASQDKATHKKLRKKKKTKPGPRKTAESSCRPCAAATSAPPQTSLPVPAAPPAQQQAEPPPPASQPVAQPAPAPPAPVEPAPQPEHHP